MNTCVSDSELVLRAQVGERKAFDQLVRKYRPGVMKLAMHFTHNRSDAEDIAQEAFMKAFGGLPCFRRDSTFYSWLYRIAINSAKNLLVSQAHRPRAVELDMPDANLPAALTDWDMPEERALMEEVRRTINAAIAALPEVHRTAILLRELDGLSYEEIAAARCIPIGTVRSRVFRARESIDHRLRKVFDGGLGRHDNARRNAAGT